MNLLRLVESAKLVQHILFVLGYLGQRRVILCDIDSARVAGELLLADAKHREVLDIGVIERVEQISALTGFHLELLLFVSLSVDCESYPMINY